MKAQRLLQRLVVATLLCTTPGTLAAQTKAADPLTGTWSGYIGRSVANPNAVTMELKLATDGTLSGTATGPKLSPGAFKNGTFDRTTGLVKFIVLIAADDDGGNVAFEGRLANDTLAGKMTLRGETGVFKLVRQSAQANGSAIRMDPATVAIRRSFVEVTDWIARGAAVVPAEKYSYRPTASVRTYGQLVAHVVDGLNYYCGRAAGKNSQWSDAAEKGTTTKAALARMLKQAVAQCATQYDGSREIGALVDNVGHSSLHYGNMVTYIRMLGLTPPSS
jgi:hypothetical protein